MYDGGASEKLRHAGSRVCSHQFVLYGVPKQGRQRRHNDADSGSRKCFAHQPGDQIFDMTSSNVVQAEVSQGRKDVTGKTSLVGQASGLSDGSGQVGALQLLIVVPQRGQGGS